MLAIITDTHVGARSSSSIFRTYMKDWYANEFFPKLEERGVETILHLGDFFDNRNSITLADIDFVINWFAPMLIKHDVKMIVVLGNHDVAYKNTNKVHSLSMLKAAAPDNVEVIEDVTTWRCDNQDFVLVPWINASNYDTTLQALSAVANKADVIVAGHFEFAGFKHYANSSPADHGMDASLFKDFKEVWSGHYHHPSKLTNVRYMGSAFHLNWQDYNDNRGFWLFDDSLEYVENDTCLFIRAAFDADIFKAMQDYEYVDAFEGMFVQLVVDGDYDKVALMDVVAKINRAKPHDLQIINNQVLKEGNSQAADADLEVRTSKTTEEYISSYIEDRDDFNVVGVRDKMAEVYKKAQDIMVKGE